MEPWFAKAVLRCYGCEYDVTQTLRDGFRICPECGSEISEENCGRDLDYLPEHVRRWVYLSWAAPLAALGVPAALSLPWLLGVLVPPTVAGVYYGWWWVEQWLQGAGAWRRAVGPTLAVLTLDAAAAVAVAVAIAAAWG